MDRVINRFDQLQKSAVPRRLEVTVTVGTCTMHFVQRAGESVADFEARVAAGFRSNK